MITIIGKNSQLSHAFTSLCEFDYVALDSSDLDLLDLNSIQNNLRKHKSKYILNFASFNDVLDSETNKNAELINHFAVQELARFCKANFSTLVHISSDYVFDGQKGNYSEIDNPNPINRYGRSKLSGEEKIRSICDQYIIIRTAWLFSDKNSKNNFLNKILNLIINLKQQDLFGAGDLTGSPTSAYSLASAIHRVIEYLESYDQYSLYGTYHFADAGSASRYELINEIAKNIFEKYGIKANIKKVKSDFFDDDIKRPKDTSLNTEKFSNVFKYTPIGWKESLKEVFKKI